MEENKKPVNSRAIAVTGMLIAVSFVLQYFEFPLPFMPSFIKFDFSDLPALLGSFAIGPLSGVLIALGKNLLHCLVTQSFGVGELSNFILSAVFVLPAGWIYKKKKTRSRALIGALVGALISALVSIPSNYYVVYPVYTAFMPMETIISMYQAILPSIDNLLEALVIFNAPFTFGKEMISVVITFFIYKPLSPILKGTSHH